MAGLIRFELPPIVVTVLTLAYIAFYPVDYFFISRSFIPAAIHLVFFVAVVKILTARTDRDYLFLKVIAFLELLAACIVSAQLQLFRFPAALPGARRGDVCEQRDSAIAEARLFARQDFRRRRDRPPDRRRAVRLARDPGDHRRVCSSSCRAPRAPPSSTWCRIAIIWRVSRTT